MTVKPLPASDLEQYDRLAIKHGCLFNTIKWTSLFEPGVQRFGIYDGGRNLRGGFCIYEQRRFGLKVHRNPPYTPCIGPFFEYRAINPAARTQEQRDVVEAMAEYLACNRTAIQSFILSMNISDCLPFYWRNFKVVPRYTYHLDLTATAEQILSGMSTERRKNITKAQKDGLAVEEVSETHEFRSLVLETYARQRMRFPCGQMDAILETFHSGASSYCIVSKYQERPVAGVYIVHDSKTAYYLLGGYSSSNTHHGAGALAMYHAILKAKARGLQLFDFEGSEIPPIEKYFRGFGGRLTSAFCVSKAWLPLEMALKLVKRRLF